MNPLTHLTSLLLLLVLGVRTFADDTVRPPKSKVQLGEVFEIAFTSSREYQNPFQEVEGALTFTSPTGLARTVAAFWDGGTTWRVRFSPDELGEWRYESYSVGEDTGLGKQKGSFRCVPYWGADPIRGHGGLGISRGKTYLTYADGSPFFWLADTAWNGALKADLGDWDKYLSYRAKEGFTAIQFVMTQWIAAAANMDGRVAYEGHEAITVDPAFFQRMDSRIQAINDHGMVAAPVMIWDAPWSEFSKNLNPGNSLDDDQIIRLAKYMLNRYDAYQVIWILAGDGVYRDAAAERWRKIGRAVFGEQPRRPVTMHPAGQQLIAKEFENEPWYNFVGYQSGHGDSANDLKWIFSGPPATEWKAQPARPFINLEPNYEAHLSFQGRRPFDAHAIRRAAYWSLLVSPTAGVTYGAHGIWSWESFPAIPMNHPGSGTARPWFEAMHLPGGIDMKYLHQLFSSLPWWSLRPAPQLVIDNSGVSNPERFVAAAGSEDGKLAVLYFPVGESIKLDGVRPRFSTLKWFNPRNGEWSGVLKFPDQATIDAPDTNDWVAVLQSN